MSISRVIFYRRVAIFVKKNIDDYGIFSILNCKNKESFKKKYLFNNVFNWVIYRHLKYIFKKFFHLTIGLSSTEGAR